MRYIKIVVAYLIDLVITSFMTVWMWNNIISELFGITTITIMQGWAVSLAISYFFKSKSDKQIGDYFTFILMDIVYTLVLWLIAFVVVLFAF